MSRIATAPRELLSSLRVTLALVGAVSLLAGVLILAWPARTVLLMTAILASWLVLGGLIYIALAVFSRENNGWARLGHALLGVLYVLAGVAAFANIVTVTFSLAIVIALLVGISWIADGIVALSLLGDAATKVWTIAYAVLSMLGGIALLFMPLYGASVLWWLLGIALVVLGATQIIRAIRLGGGAKPIVAAPAVRTADLGEADK